MRRDIEREVQGGSVNVKFDQMKRMMGASKLIAVFQKRAHWWKAKAIFRWKYGHVDMLVHQLRRLSKKLDATTEDSEKVKDVLYDVETNLINITGMQKELKRKRSSAKRGLDDIKETFGVLTNKVTVMMKDLEDKRTQALKDVQDIYGDQSLFERDQLLKRIVFKTRNRLWRKGWVQWNFGIHHQKNSNRGHKIASSHYSNKLNTKIFKAWLLYKTRSVRVEQLFKQKRSRRAKEIFNEIKYVRSERQYQRSLFERIFERTRMHVIRDVFSPWKMAMIDYQNQDEINELKDQLKEWKLKQMCMLLKRHYRVIKGMGFKTWESETNEAASIRRKLVKAAAKMMHRKTAMVMEQWKQYVLARVTQRKRVKRIVSRLCNGKLFMGFKHWVNVVEYINNGEARIIQRQKLLQTIMSKMFKQWSKFAVNEWKEWTENENRTRVALMRAAARMKNRNISMTFQQWCGYVKTRQYERRMMQNLITRLSKSNYAKGFYTWKSNIEMSDEHFNFMEKVFSRMINTKVLSGWQTWVAMVEGQKEYERALKRAVSSWTKGAMKKTFEYWHWKIVSNKKENVLLQRAAAKIMRRQSMMAFETWLEFQSCRRRLGKLLFNIFNRLNSDQEKMYKYGFSTWKLNIEKGRVAKDYDDYLTRMRKLLLTKLLKRSANRNLRVAVDIWEFKTDENKQHALKIRRMSRRRNKKILMKIFEEWVIVHEEQVRMNVIVRRALAKMHNRLVAAVFDSWNENIQEKIRIRVMLRRFGKKMRQRVVLSAYNRWDEYRNERIHFKQLAWKVLSRLGKTKLLAGWAKWDSVVKAEKAEQDHQRALMVRILKRLFNGKLSSALRSWKDMVEEDKRNKIIMMRVAAKMQKRVIAGAFFGWSDAVNEIVENRFKVKRALMRMKMRVAASMFNTWIDMVEERKRLRKLVSKTVKRMLNGKLNAGWKTWVKVTMQNRNSANMAQSAALKMLNPALVSCLNTWKGNVATIKHHRYALKKAAMKWANRTLSAYFNAFADFVSEERILRTKLSKAVKKIRNKTISQSMESWIDYIKDIRRLRYLRKRAVNKWRRRVMLMTWSSWQNTVEMYKQRKTIFMRILCKTRLKLLRKGTTKWRYVILGLRLSGKKQIEEQKARLPPLLNTPSTTQSMIERFFLESGWDHNFVAEKLPEYDAVSDVHCTYAHTPEYKKQHDQILALEELDRQRLRNTFPGQKFLKNSGSSKRVDKLQTEGKESKSGTTTASGSPHNAVKALKSKRGKGNEMSDIEIGEDVVEYLTNALEHAEKQVVELKQENMKMKAEVELEKQVMMQKMEMKKSQLDEILRLQSEDLNEVEVKYEESTKEANQYQKELQEEIKQLENKIVELEDQEEALYTEKSKAKINETEMKKQLLTLQEEFNILKEKEELRQKESSAGTDSVSTMRRELDDAIEDLHEQNEVIQMMRQRMAADQRAREIAEMEVKKLKDESAKVIEEKLKIAKEEFVRVQERMSSMKHKLTESRHDISRLDQQQQLAEKRWEEDKVKILTEKATIVSEMKIMSREKRQSDLYIQELKDRLAIFEKGNVGHHHHGRHHHHHHHHKRHRPQTAGPATRAGRKKFLTPSDGLNGKVRGSKKNKRPASAKPVRREIKVWE